MKRMVCFLALISVTSILHSHERNFAYVYESRTLPAGKAEIELYETFRFGRASYYSALDTQVEFELGLTDRFMVALYATSTWEHKMSGSTESKAFKAPGLKLQAKGQLLDPVADALGLALYGEIIAKPHELEMEGKIILDKKIGPLLLAFNLVGEHAWKIDAPTQNWGTELKLGGLFGATFVFGPVGLGIESRNSTTLVGGVVEGSPIYVGPVFSWHAKKFWLNLSTGFQVTDAKLGTPDLSKAERTHVRLLVGMPL